MKKEEYRKRKEHMKKIAENGIQEHFYMLKAFFILLNNDWFLREIGQGNQKSENKLERGKEKGNRNNEAGD